MEIWYSLPGIFSEQIKLALCNSRNLCVFTHKFTKGEVAVFVHHKMTVTFRSGVIAVPLLVAKNISLPLGEEHLKFFSLVIRNIAFLTLKGTSGHFLCLEGNDAVLSRDACVLLLRSLSHYQAESPGDI